MNKLSKLFSKENSINIFLISNSKIRKKKIPKYSEFSQGERSERRLKLKENEKKRRYNRKKDNSKQ